MKHNWFAVALFLLALQFEGCSAVDRASASADAAPSSGGGGSAGTGSPGGAPPGGGSGGGGVSSTSGGGTTPAGGAGGTHEGGGGASGVGATGSGGAAGTGGSACMPPGGVDPCDYLPQCGCQSQLNCVVRNKGTICVPVGTAPVFGQCFNNLGGGACPAGTDCLYMSCRPFCETPSDCPNNRPCRYTKLGTDAVVPGFAVCALPTPCDPTRPSTSGCPTVSGVAAACLPVAGTTTTDCDFAGTKGTGSTCSKSKDCVAGHVCEPGSMRCRRYCLTSTECGGGTCTSLGQPGLLDGKQYGFCP